MEKHFVTFYSPGTFISETNEKPIETWDVELAKQMARDIKQRYNATPYGFRFTTRARGQADLDSKEIKSSPVYYLGGIIKTKEEILAGTDPKESTLRFNVEANDIKRIIVNDNSWRFTGPLNDDDVVLEFLA